MDNRVFNVNGSGQEMLKMALELAFMQDGMNSKCKSWIQTKENGLILLWADGKDSNSLPSSLIAADCMPMIKSWLEGDFAKSVKLADWCEDNDHDGHNSDGWQVYCEDWGHVGSNHYAICGIRPSFMWHGK